MIDLHELPCTTGYFNRPGWYLKDRTPIPTVKDKRTRSYFELVETVLPETGDPVERLVEREYPITPERVTSLAAGCDYRNDVVGAIANAPKRANLGDVRSIQEAFGLDYETAHHIYSEFRAAVSRAEDKLKGQSLKDQSVLVENGGDNNGTV